MGKPKKTESRGISRPAGAAVLALPLLAIAAYFVLHEYARAAAFVVRVARVEGIARTAAGWQSEPVVERSLRVPWRDGELPARWYAPPNVEHPPVLLVPGVHASGIDEPRLVGFARDLAAVNHPVLTVQVDDLTQYAITPRSTDMIEDAARWLADQRQLAPRGRIGIIGISFAGGLGIVAAGRVSVRDEVAFVMSLGGHGDLARTLRYLCTGVLPDGSIHPPHDYGVAVILLGIAERLVPPDQVQPLREAIHTFLDASRLHLEDPGRSAAQFGRAREQEAALPEPARTLMGLVNARDVKQLGSRLLPYVSDLAADPALSPSRSRPPAADVYLLHGADDNVIPAAESELLAVDLRGRGSIVHLLKTPLVTHAAVERPPRAAEVWDLVRFCAQLLNEQ